MIWALLVVIAGCSDDGTGPHLSSVEPRAAKRDTEIVIGGSRFCPRDCGAVTGELLLGIDVPQIRVPVTGFDSSTMVATVPHAAPIGETSLILVVDGTSSNAIDFMVIE